MRIVSYIVASFALSTADIVAMPGCQFQKDRDEQARCEFERVLSMNVWVVGCTFVSFDFSTADIVAMPVCQFQKDRDEQARNEFERVLSMNVRIVGNIVCSFAFLQVILWRCGCANFRRIATSKQGANSNLFFQ